MTTRSLPLSRPLPGDPLVLIVEDDHGYRELLARSLAEQCALCQTLGVPNAEEALAVLEQQQVRMVIADERLVPRGRGLTGTELLEIVGQRWPDVRRTLLSAYVTGHLITTLDYTVLDKGFAWWAILDTICRKLRQ